MSDQKRPDFLARDSTDNMVLIECKGMANEDAVLQMKEYLSKFKKEAGARAVIVAFKTSPECRTLAKKYGVELFECDLTFSKVEIRS